MIVRDGTRKTKVKLEMNLARNTTGRAFYRCRKGRSKKVHLPQYTILENW